MPAFTPASLRRTLAVAGYQDGERVEFAAIPAERRGIFVLWITIDEPGLEIAASWLSTREGAQNLYLLANPLLPEIKRGRGKRALDVHCASSRMLLLDADPVKVRPKDVESGKATPKDLDPSGTRPEKLAAAAGLAEDIKSFLADRLDARPAHVSSGRGRQLWVIISGDLAKRDRKRFVRGLAARFDRPGLATVDRSTHNLARLMRLPGSRNLRTGDVAQVLDDANPSPAAAERIRELLDELDPQRRPARRARGPRPASGHQAGEHDGPTEGALVESALEAIDPDTDYDTWKDIGMALQASDLPNAYDLWDGWSSTGAGYDGPEATRAKWASFSADGGIALGTLFDLAAKAGWVRPAPTRREEQLLPLLDVSPPPRAVTARAEADRLVMSVVRAAPRRRGGQAAPAPVVQDRRPTGSGKTTRAAGELVQGVAEDQSRYVWASPSHDLARLEVLPALAAAGAAIWDEDLDGAGEVQGVRQRLAQLGATVLPLGEPPPDPATPVAVKFAPFCCPGPEVAGWTADSVAELYADAASRGWNPATTVCRACPRFLGEDGEPCSYWAARQIVAEADILVVPHHSLRAGSGAASGRRALVVDEDPANALIKRLEVSAHSARAFLALVDVATESVGAEAQCMREELELLAARARHFGDLDPEDAQRRDELVGQLDARDDLVEDLDYQVEVVEIVAGHLQAVLAILASVSEAAYEVSRPAGVDLDDLAGLGDLARACERQLRRFAKSGEGLVVDGERVGSIRNLFPFLRELARVWATGREAVLHVRGQGKKVRAVLPTVERLPKLPVLALDATGDPRLLSLATGRAVATIEGEATGRLHGLHLAGFPCGRRRWKHFKTRARRGGRTASEALSADIDVIIRHVGRVAGRRAALERDATAPMRIGLVTFKFVRDEMAAELTRRAGFEVRALHYGGEVGSNAFAGWADLVVVAGTPFVPEEEVRLRAGLEGAGLEELLAAPVWERRRLMGGGAASVLTRAGAASQRAYATLVRARLEQSLGRAMRWDWVPPCGVLVLAEPWPTRHQLRLSTRRREALDGPSAELFEALGDRVVEAKGRDPIEWIEAAVRRLVSDVGGAAEAARMVGVSSRSARMWVAGDVLPSADRVASLRGHFRRKCAMVEK